MPRSQARSEFPLLWIILVLAIAVAFSWYVHAAAERARAGSIHGDEPAIIVSIPLAGRFPTADERRLLYGISDEIQARNVAALVDVGVRNRRMYLRLAATDVETATARIREVLEARGVADSALIEAL